VGAHFGSFEVLRSLGQARRGLRVAMVMYEENAQLMKHALDPLARVDTLKIIALGRVEAMLKLRDWLDTGGVAGMLADRTLPGSSQRAAGLHAASFLGDQVMFSDGPFRLAALLRRPTLFMAGIYHGDNRYELRFLPLADFSERASGARREEVLAEAVARYAAVLERLCIEAPYNWFNFFDFWAAPGVPDPHDASLDSHALASRTFRH